MDELFKGLERLAARAREEKPPEIDAAARVRARLRTRPENWEAPLGVFALGSLAASIVVFVSCFNLLWAITDPLGVVFWMTTNIAP